MIPSKEPVDFKFTIVFVRRFNPSLTSDTFFACLQLHVIVCGATGGRRLTAKLFGPNRFGLCILRNRSPHVVGENWKSVCSKTSKRVGTEQNERKHKSQVSKCSEINNTAFIFVSWSEHCIVSAFNTYIFRTTSKYAIGGLKFPFLEIFFLREHVEFESVLLAKQFLYNSVYRMIYACTNFELPLLIYKLHHHDLTLFFYYLNITWYFGSLL